LASSSNSAGASCQDRCATSEQCEESKPREQAGVAQTLAEAEDLHDKRLEMVAHSRGIKPKEGESAPELLIAFVRKVEGSALGRLIVETIILLSARTQPHGGKVLRAAAPGLHSGHQCHRPQGEA